MNPAETAGRSGHGADGLCSTARQGQTASVVKPSPVATTCCGVVPPSPGSGKNATATEQAPPSSSMTRPAGRTRLSPHAVTK
ncbi:hypothetical protein ABH926_002126 [Catenulispora sp. GP43]